MKNDSLQNELKFLLGDRYSTSLSARNNFGGGEDVFEPILSQAVLFPQNNEEIACFNGKVHRTKKKWFPEV